MLHIIMSQEAWALVVLAGTELVVMSLVVKHPLLQTVQYVVQSHLPPWNPVGIHGAAWCLSHACCCPPPFAFVGCLSKASLKTEVSWSWRSNQCGSKPTVLRLCMSPLDLKRLEFIGRSWVRLHMVKILNPVDLLKALKMASYYLPVICIKCDYS